MPTKTYIIDCRIQKIHPRSLETHLDTDEWLELWIENEGAKNVSRVKKLTVGMDCPPEIEKGSLIRVHIEKTWKVYPYATAIVYPDQQNAVPEACLAKLVTASWTKQATQLNPTETPKTVELMVNGTVTILYVNSRYR